MFACSRCPGHGGAPRAQQRPAGGGRCAASLLRLTLPPRPVGLPCPASSCLQGGWMAVSSAVDALAAAGTAAHPGRGQERRTAWLVARGTVLSPAPGLWEPQMHFYEQLCQPLGKFWERSGGAV